MPSKAIYIQPAPWAHDDTEARLRSRRRIATGVALSLVLHALLYVLIPKPVETDGTPTQVVQGPLEVRLNQQPPAAPAAAPIPPPPTPTAPPPPRRTIMAIPKLKPTAPSFAIEQPAPPSPLPTQATAQPTITEQPSMMAMVEAARERRRLAEEAVGKENAAGRANSREQSAEEIRTANINRNLQTLKPSRDGTNGVFQILFKGHRSSEFAFRGWTTDERASVRQVYEVDAGQGGDVELATVRKMIEIIRTHYKDKFNWESQRLGRVIQLSARTEDSANLETFLVREFFGS